MTLYDATPFDGFDESNRMTEYRYLPAEYVSTMDGSPNIYFTTVDVDIYKSPQKGDACRDKSCKLLQGRILHGRIVDGWLEFELDLTFDCRYVQLKKEVIYVLHIALSATLVQFASVLVAIWLACKRLQYLIYGLLVLVVLVGFCAQHASLAHLTRALQQTGFPHVADKINGPWRISVVGYFVPVASWIVDALIGLPEFLDMASDGATAGGATLSDASNFAFRNSWGTSIIATLGLQKVLYMILFVSVVLQIGVPMWWYFTVECESGEFEWSTAARYAELSSLRSVAGAFYTVERQFYYRDKTYKMWKAYFKGLVEAAPTQWLAISWLGLAIGVEKKSPSETLVAILSICTSFVALLRAICYIAEVAALSRIWRYRLALDVLVLLLVWFVVCNVLRFCGTFYCAGFEVTIFDGCVKFNTDPVTSYYAPSSA